MTTAQSLNPEMYDISLNKLFIDLAEDGGYQRPLDEVWVEAHVSIFDPLQLGALKVSQRDEGVFAVIDGQQRAELLRRVGWEYAPCLLYEGLTREDEARIFVAQDDKKEVKPYDYFQARLFMRDPGAVAIQEIVDRLGYRLVRTKAYSARTIRAVDGLDRTYRQGGAELVEWILKLFAYWTAPDQRVNLQGGLLSGLSYWKIHARTLRGDEPSDVRLFKRIVTRTPDQILARANAMLVTGTGGGRSPRQVAEAINEIYNKGLRDNRLILG